MRLRFLKECTSGARHRRRREQLGGARLCSLGGVASGYLGGTASEYLGGAGPRIFLSDPLNSNKTGAWWHKNVAVPRSRPLRPEQRAAPSSMQAIYQHVYRGVSAQPARLTFFGPSRRSKSRHAGQSVPRNFRLLASSHPVPTIPGATDRLYYVFPRLPASPYFAPAIRARRLRLSRAHPPNTAHAATLTRAPIPSSGVA